MWNFHFCFNRRLTCCNRTSFPGITDLHLARRGCVARVKTAFEKIATVSVASFCLRRIVDESSNSSWWTLPSRDYIFNSFFLFIRSLCLFPILSSLIYLYLCTFLCRIFICRSYTRLALLFPISSYSSFSPSVGILETPRSVPLLFSV